jgi:thioredoxin 1
MAVTITSSNFESEVLQSPVPVLLDFWAEWCRPCKMLSPILDEVAGEEAGKIKLGKVNVDEEAALAEKHNVVSIPSLFIYKDGKIAAQQVGALPKVQVQAFIKDFVS